MPDGYRSIGRMRGGDNAMINPDEAPAGHRAVQFNVHNSNCKICALYGGSCSAFKCLSNERRDESNVIFLKVAELINQDEVDIKCRFLETAETRKTSPEIMRAILEVAGGSEARALAIWLDPDEESFLEIYSIVTCQGMIDSTAFIWGDHGDQWGYQ